MMNCEHPVLLSSSTDGQTLFEVLELMFSFNALTNVFDSQSKSKLVWHTEKICILYMFLCSLCR